MYEYKEIKRECMVAFNNACDWLQLDPLDSAGAVFSLMNVPGPAPAVGSAQNTTAYAFLSLTNLASGCTSKLE